MKFPLSKRSAAFFWFFLALSFSSFGQFSTQEQIDSLYEEGFSLRNGPIDSAFTLVKESAKQSKKNGYRLGEIRADVFAILYFAKKGKLDTALVIQNNVMNFFENHSELRGTFQEGFALYNSGILKWRGQKLSEAKAHYLRALEIFEKLQDTYYIPSTYSRLGLLEMNMNNYSGALTLFIKSYEMKVNSELPPSDYAPELANIATVYSRMGMEEEAFRYLHKSLQLEKERKNYQNIARAYAGFGALYNPKNIDSAIYYYNKAYKTALNHGHIKTAGITKYNLAAILKDQGKYRASINAMEEIRHQIDGFDYQDLNADIRILLAENYLRLSELDNAIKYGYEAFAESKKTGIKRRSYLSANILGRAYDSKSQIDSALFYTRLEYTYKDSVYNNENQSQIAILNSRLNNLEIQKELQVMEKQKELDKTSRLLLLTSLVALTAILSLVVLLLLYRHKSNQRKQQQIKLLHEKEIREKEHQLRQQTLYMINMNNGVSMVETQLSDLKDKKVIAGGDVQKVLSNIKINKAVDKEWENFDNYFGVIHSKFYENLKEKHPSLSIQARRLAALVKIDLSNREIAQILNISQPSAKMSRYRLKSKLELGENDDLAQYLREI